MNVPIKSGDHGYEKNHARIRLGGMCVEMIGECDQMQNILPKCDTRETGSRTCFVKNLHSRDVLSPIGYDLTHTH